jgi:hypothetical protein
MGLNGVVALTDHDNGARVLMWSDVAGSSCISNNISLCNLAGSAPSANHTDDDNDDEAANNATDNTPNNSCYVDTRRICRSHEFRIQDGDTVRLVCPHHPGPVDKFVDICLACQATHDGFASFLVDACHSR